MFGFGIKAMIGMVSPEQVREALGEILPQLNDEIRTRLALKFPDPRPMNFMMVNTKGLNVFVLVYTSESGIELGPVMPVAQMLKELPDHEITALLNKIADGQ